MAHEPGEVSLRSVTKTYGDDLSCKTVIRDCSFSLAEGRFTAVIGPSGCGKTTLVNLIAGYESPSSGEILLDGRPISGPSRDRLVVFQETALFPWMTTLENVMYGPMVGRTLSRSKIREMAIALLKQVGLEQFQSKYPVQLSGGMQRRAELARALINHPKVMLMDEPFRGLDAMTRELMQEYFLRLFEEYRHTTLFVTSEIEEAIFLADTLIVLTSSPAAVKLELQVDLPRPREVAMMTSSRYAELKAEALEALHEEAVQALAAGGRAAYDLVDAYKRHGQTTNAAEEQP